MLENKALRVFLEVAKTQNMTKAANHLHMTEPSVSRLIKSLEDRLGYRLFQRHSKTVVLTKNGQLLQERAQVIVNLVLDLEYEFNHLEHQITGKINLGLAETQAFRLIASSLVSMHQRYPKVIFGIESGNAEQVCSKLDSGLYDFGLVVTSIPNLEKYQVLTLPQYDTWGVVMPKDHPLAQRDVIEPQDLIGEPLLFSRQEQLQSAAAERHHPVLASEYAYLKKAETSRTHLWPADVRSQESVKTETKTKKSKEAVDFKDAIESQKVIPQKVHNSQASTLHRLNTSQDSLAVTSASSLQTSSVLQTTASSSRSFFLQDTTLSSKTLNLSDKSLITTITTTHLTGVEEASGVGAQPRYLNQFLETTHENLDENLAYTSAEQSWAERNEWSSISPFKAWFGADYDKLNVVTTFNLGFNAYLLVEEGMGLMLSIDGLCDFEHHPNLCFRPLSPPIYSKAAMIWPRFRSFTPAARLLRDELLAKWGHTSNLK